MSPEPAAAMHSNTDVRDLTVAALMTERRERIYHAAMTNPQSADELDPGQVHDLVDRPNVADGYRPPERGHT